MCRFLVSWNYFALFLATPPRRGVVIVKLSESCLKGRRTHNAVLTGFPPATLFLGAQCSRTTTKFFETSLPVQQTGEAKEPLLRQSFGI